MTRAPLAAVLALTCALTAPAFAQDEAPDLRPDDGSAAAADDGAWLAQRPEVGAPEPFDPPATDEIVLDNGLAITFIPFGLAPKTEISVQIRVGNLNDGEDIWLADLTGDLMAEGAAGMDGAGLAQAAAGMGGSLDIGVGMHTTEISMSVLSENAAEAAALLGAVVTAPALPESELPRIRDSLVRDLTVALADPGPLAQAIFAEALYGPDHPYGRIFPSEGQLSAYTPEQVRDFYAANYGAARTHIYVAGRYDRGAVEDALRQAFGDWAAGPPPLDLPPAPRSDRRVILLDRPGAPQSTILLGLPTFGPDNARDVQLRVANTILGGAFTSRITQNIREDKGYTYSPRSTVTHNIGDGYWSFRADVTTDVTGAALEEVFKEIERLRTEAPTEDEAARTRNYAAGVYVIQSASPSGLIGKLAFRDLHGLPDDYVEAFVPAVLAVSAEDIRAAAQDLLDPARMVMVVVGDLAEIRPQLDSLAAIEGVTIQRTRPPGAPAPDCTVQISIGEARLYGACTEEALAEALLTPAAVPPADSGLECAVDVSGSEPVYDGCLNLSAAGLELLADAARAAAP